MIIDQHWWKTADGRLVPDGDPGAAVLAYPRHTEIPDATAARLGIELGAMPAARVPDVPPDVLAEIEALKVENARLQADNESLRVELDAVRQESAEAPPKAADKSGDKAASPLPNKGRRPAGRS